jgi:signal transduction histidine kinase
MIDDNLFYLFGKASKKVFFVYNLHTRQFDYLSEAVERIWKTSRDAVQSSPQQLLDSIHPDDRSAITSRFEKLIEEGAPQEVKFSLQLPNDARKEVNVDAYPITDEAGNLIYIAGEAEDITKQSEYLDYLLEFSRRKNTALEMVAHDLLGPLSIVKGITTLLESEHQEQKYEEISTYTEIILNAYDNCLELITEVLSAEHLKSPTIYVNLERFDLVDRVQRLLRSYQIAQGANYTFDLICDEKPLIVELDELKLVQVLNNLLSNSIKFTKPGGKISITLRREGQKLLIIHTDNGIGIPEELQPMVFDRHNRTSREGLRGEPTHGVGMAILRELVEIQGGKIWLESEENKGTTYFLSFTLPDE